MGPRLCAFCWGTRKMKESRLSLSWCLGGELGTGVSAAVRLLGVGCVFGLDMASVTCEGSALLCKILKLVG